MVGRKRGIRPFRLPFRTPRGGRSLSPIIAISKDSTGDAQRMNAEVGLDFPVLSDPSMEMISRYGMMGEGMPMADMGYVLIDASGRVRVRRIDRQFGEHAGEIVNALQEAVRVGAGSK